MIEKCSIGNMTNNIQNITLILLILILIIVIIYYLKNSNAKHNELIEKYTNTPIISSDASYITHYSANSQRNSNFPSTGTTVTLRDCQVQFNNTFTKDDNFTVDDNATVKYTYADEWKEIDTLTEPGSSPIRIPEKIISRSNETNAADITNYSERSKCFKKMSSTASDNKYRYAGNNLIQYRAGSASEQGIHSELKVGADGTLENYMEMKFNLAPSNSTNYYTDLTSSICSLQYSDTVPGLSGNLIRLSLNANNIITDINRVSVNSTNNHIFTIDSTFNISNLITSTTSGKYRYNSASSSYEYETTNTASSGLIININLYQFNRNLLCDKTSGTTTYQNIKTYTKLSNAKININSIVDINLPPKSTISNTALPTRYNTNTNITGDNIDKETLIRNIDALIESELVNVNSGANSDISRLNIEKSALILVRDTFIDSIPSLQTFINNAIIKSNYDNSNLKYNTLLNSDNYNLKLKKVEYSRLNFNVNDATINLSVSEEPTIKEVLTSAEIDVIRYRTDIVQSVVSKKISLEYDNILETQIYNNNSTLTLNSSATADILIVGGGAGGARNDGAEGGGGGGGGGVIHAKLKISDSSSRVLNIKIGSGGAPNNAGEESSITYNNNSGYQIKLIADGGGTGGGSYAGCGDGKGGIGKPGGSGGGGSGFCHDLDGGASTGVKNKSDIQNNDSSIVSYNYYGNKGGLGHNQAGGAGGGGAGEVGYSTPKRYDRPGRQGGSGINIPLFDDKYYGAGGGGGGSYSNVGGNGGLGGGGNGAQRGYNASNGLANTGSGGGGAHDATPGSGGSGIVIIKYNNNNAKIYKLRVPKRTNIEFKTYNTIHYTGNLHGTYKITMNSTNIKIEVYPGVSGTQINIDDIIINSNKMDIIYNLNKSLDDINTTDINATSPTVIDIYNNTIPYTHTHYNRYKINSHISKTYKITTSGVESVNFNMYLYSNTDVLIPSANYSIRYHYPSTDSKNVIIPIHIFITIKPMPSNATYTGLKIKTYSRRANGSDETEIYAFIGKTNGQDTSIFDFNSILNLTTSLTEKDVWGIVAKQSEINTQERTLINKNNIEAIICNISQTNDRICDIKTLISIKNSINNTTFTGRSPNMIQNVSIKSAGLFPMSAVNPILNYNITDYISYESATVKAPANRSTQFNILNNASKYIYFAIPSASS